MHADPETWHALAAGWVAGVTAAFLRAQILAGASAVQLFDSWAGGLSLADYQRFVAEHSAAVLASVSDLPVPRVHFGVNTGELLAAMRDAGADVMGIDHRVPLDVANERLGGRTRSRATSTPLCCSPATRPCTRRRSSACGSARPLPAMWSISGTECRRTPIPTY